MGEPMTGHQTASVSCLSQSLGCKLRAVVGGGSPACQLQLCGAVVLTVTACCAVLAVALITAYTHQTSLKLQ